VIIRKSAGEIERIAEAGTLVAETITHVSEQLAPGVSMVELDEVADAYIREHGGVPTSKGYRGYPAAICISPNEVIVHGIPNGYRAREGDVVSIDVGVTLAGFIADSAFTFPVGEVSDEADRLLVAGEEALAAGIEQARLGNHVGDISSAIQRTVEEAGFAVVRQLVGHGVGRSYHEDPHVPNFGRPGSGPRLVEGMTIAIEPMITAGSHEIVIGDDRWTISTEDGSLAAHFEHTVAVTKAGPRILTTARARLLQ